MMMYAFCLASPLLSGISTILARCNITRYHLHTSKTVFALINLFCALCREAVNYQCHSLWFDPPHQRLAL
jgi:hypothetical protein